MATTQSSVFTTSKGTKLPLSVLKGKDYLMVMWRLVWVREDHPTDWGIETAIVHMTDTSAVVKAVIKDGNGKVLGTGHKSENFDNFADFIEKAETGAIGRALAHCGYGTQFEPELDEKDRIVDSPVEKSSGGVKRGTAPNAKGPAKEPAPSGTPLRSDRPLSNGMAGDDGKIPYIIPFGKFRGQNFDDIPGEDLINYADWLEKKSREEKRPIENMDVVKFIGRVRDEQVTCEEMSQKYMGGIGGEYDDR